MASAAVSEIATQAANVRAELKVWERAFAAENGGRKAGRDDIKKAPEIAAKYKEYSRLKALEASLIHGKQNGSETVRLEDHSRKRKHASPNGPDNSHPISTPRKTAKGPFETPSKKGSHPSEVDPYISPTALRRLFSPSTHQQPLKTAIGPTPQRDGKALGLFDLLSESGGSTATPSANRVASIRTATVQTPSKRRIMDTITEEEEEEEEESPRAGRTPASSGKKYMLSTLFATPTTLRYAAMVENEDENAAGDHGTRTNTDGAINEVTSSDTPSFLRRSNSARYGASHPALNGGGLSPIAVRKPPQFVGKGLSALVQGLRDMEEESLQADLDVLHEIEAEQAAMNAEVTDSQAPAIGRPYKKKGQKRTTRRVNMKPVISKPKPVPQLPGPEDEVEGDDANESDDELAAVPETQIPTFLNRVQEGDQDDDFDDDLDDVASLHTMSEPELDSDSDYGEESRPIVKSKSFSEKMKEALGVVKPKPKDRPEKVSQPVVKEDENKKPRARKVNPQAHANYRSLKIRNRNSKGRGAGRFGRR